MSSANRWQRAAARALLGPMFVVGPPALAQSAAGQPSVQALPAAVGSPLPQASADPEPRSSDRLERFRNALIDQALDAPVRVTSNAWLDESGQLRHVSRFFSEIRARAASDVLFQAGEASGRAAAASVTASTPNEAKLQPPNPISVPDKASGAMASAPSQTATAGEKFAMVGTPSSAAVSSAASALAANEPCRVGGSDLARLAVIDSTIYPADGARGHAVLHELERFVHQLLGERSRAGGLRVVGLEPLQADSYSRLLTATGQLDAPYRIRISIQSDRLDQVPMGQGAQPEQSPIKQVLWTSMRAVSDLASPPISRMPDRRVDVTIALIEQFGSTVVLRQDWTLVLPGTSPSINSLVLPDKTMSDVRVAVLTWWADALERLRCQPVAVRAQPSPIGSVTIPMGALAGVRVGDRWAVADPSKIPVRVLEPGALERALLAEVVSVGPYRSVLRLTSDASNARTLFSFEKGASWFATPL